MRPTRALHSPRSLVPDLIHLCTCGDAAVRWGLHVALSSALRALAPGVEAHIAIIDLGLGPEEPALLRETLQRTGRAFHLALLPADFTPLGDLEMLRPFYGSWAPYLKLLVPSHLPAWERVIFLDADTVVCTDLLALYRMDLGEKIAGCVDENPISTAFEGAYYRRAGFPEDALFFNSGVMLLDLERWRRAGLSEQCAALVRRDGAELLCADQTVLNVVLRGRYRALPSRFNQLVYPSSRRVEPRSADGIYHLVGQPKPWEPFSEFFNQQSALFRHHLEATALAGWRSWQHLDWQGLQRMARLARSYWKAWKTRVR